METIKEPCDILLLAGQSNAVGLGIGEVTKEIEDDPRVYMLYDAQPETYLPDGKGGEYLMVKEPWQFALKNPSEKNGTGNLALSFAARYIADGRLKAGRRLLIVRAAVCGTAFCKREWRVGDILHRRMLDMLDAALSMNAENRVIALLWHQGESDALEKKGWDAKERRLAYETHFSALIDSVRKGCNNEKLPVLTGGFTDEWSAFFKEECAAVIAATQAVCERVGYARFHSSNGLLSNNQKTGNGDDIHFCKESLHILGENYYHSYVEILKGEK